MRKWTLFSAFVLAASGFAAGPAAAAPLFDGQRAFALLERQVAFGPRVPGTPAHRRCVAWMRERLVESGAQVIPHSFVHTSPYDGQRRTLTNLRARFGPVGASPLALAAHWDSRPWADQEDSAEARALPVPGANDGASGVAVLLALAESMAVSAPPIPVELLFFDGEDAGREGDAEHYLVGSRRFVADFPDFRPRALILLDMVGDRDLRIPIESYSAQGAPRLAHQVFEAASLLGLPAFEPVPGPAVYDDHIPFLQKRIPALDLIDFEYPAWHTLDDRPEQCSPGSLEQVGRLLVHLIWVDPLPER